MMKPNKLFFALLTLSFSQVAHAAESVELMGANDAKAAIVDSALKESMDSPTTTPKQKPKSVKASAPKTPAAKSGVTPNDKNYTIQAGDVLQITVWKEADMDREVLVLPDGTISFPLIGSFSAEGLTPAQVQSTVKSKLATLIPDASITVVVKAALGHSVSVIGQVAKPGELVMGHNMSVMQALSQAGGLTAFADESDIIILRTVDGTQTSIEFPYDDISEGRNLDKNISLLPGDVIVVPTAGLF